MTASNTPPPPAARRALASRHRGWVELPCGTVGIRKLKRPRGSGRWRAYVLGVDRYGTWLYSPAGSLYRGTDGETTGECEVGQGNRDAGLPVVSLVPLAGWWFATWYGGDHIPASTAAASALLPHPQLIAVDVCTPPTLVDGEWSFVDLELDPHRAADGSVWVDDEDEFAEACRVGLISDDEEVAARAAATDVERFLRVGEEPFGAAGWRWLRAALARPFAPLTKLSSPAAAVGRQRAVERNRRPT